MKLLRDAAKPRLHSQSLTLLTTGTDLGEVIGECGSIGFIQLAIRKKLIVQIQLKTVPV